MTADTLCPPPAHAGFRWVALSTTGSPAVANEKANPTLLQGYAANSCSRHRLLHLVASALSERLSVCVPLV
eukprot:1244995-Prymnesium_polylepis.1